MEYYKKEDLEKQIYIPEFKIDLDNIKWFEEDKIPWINEPKIIGSISVE